MSLNSKPEGLIAALAAFLRSLPHNRCLEVALRARHNLLMQGDKDTELGSVIEAELLERKRHLEQRSR